MRKKLAAAFSQNRQGRSNDGAEVTCQEDSGRAEWNTFFAEVKDVYARRESMNHSLRADTKKHVRPIWVEAATEAMGCPPSRGKMLQLLRSTADVSQPEMCGALRWLLHLHPAASADQLEGAVAVLDMVARLNLQRHFPEECAVVRPKFDEVLLQLHACPTSPPLDTLQWLEKHEKLWPLVLPEARVRKICSAGRSGAWAAAAHEIRAVVEGSMLGRRLFLGALKAIPEDVRTEFKPAGKACPAAKRHAMGSTSSQARGKTAKAIKEYSCTCRDEES